MAIENAVVKPAAAAVLPQANPVVPVAAAAAPVVEAKPAAEPVISSDDDDTTSTGVSSSSSLSELPPSELIKGTQFHTIGDPHEMTLDGEHYDNMRSGTFTKLKAKDGSFELQTRQTVVAPGITANDAAAVKLGKDVVSFDAKSNELFVNGEKKELKPGEELKLEGGTVKAGAQPGAFDITSAKGDKVQIQSMGGWMNVSGEVSPNRIEDELEGTLGDLNGDTPEEHMDKWAVKDGETLLEQNTGKGKGPGPIEGGAPEPGPIEQPVPPAPGEQPAPAPGGENMQELIALLMQVLEKLGGAPAEAGGAEPAPAEAGGAEPAPAPEVGGAEPAPAPAPGNDEIMAIIQQILDKLAKQREEQAAADAAAAAPAKA
jgi:hypothetical protein